MDPDACLERAENAIDSGDRREALDALRDYRRWIQRGGFAPAGGAERYATIMERCRAASPGHKSGDPSLADINNGAEA